MMNILTQVTRLGLSDTRSGLIECKAVVHALPSFQRLTFGSDGLLYT